MKNNNKSNGMDRSLKTIQKVLFWVGIVVIVLLSLIFFLATVSCKSPYEPELPGGPIIKYFNATPGTIDYLDSSILSWEILNADMANIDKIGPISLTGTKEVRPKENTTYILTAYNTEGSTQKSCTITVREKAIIEMVYGPEWIGLNDRSNHIPKCWGEVENIGNDVGRNVQILLIVYDKNGNELDRQLKYTSPGILNPGDRGIWMVYWSDSDFSFRKKLDPSRTIWEFFFDSGY